MIICCSLRSIHIKWTKVFHHQCCLVKQHTKHRGLWDSEKLKLWGKAADRMLPYLRGQTAEQVRPGFGCKQGLIHTLTGTTLADTIRVGCSNRNLTVGSFSRKYTYISGQTTWWLSTQTPQYNILLQYSTLLWTYRMLKLKQMKLYKTVSYSKKKQGEPSQLNSRHNGEHASCLCLRRVAWGYRTLSYNS